MRLRPDFRAAVSLKKTVSTASRANKLENPFLQNNTRDDIFLPAHRGGTSVNGIGGELTRFFYVISFFKSWFRLQSIAIHCNRRVCRQIHFTRHFSHAVCIIHFMHITLDGSSVCLYLHAIHDERLIVRSLSVSSCLSFSCFSLLFISSLLCRICTLTSTLSSMWTAPRETPAALSLNEEYCPLAICHLPDFLLYFLLSSMSSHG